MSNSRDRGDALVEIARTLHAAGAIDHMRLSEFEAAAGRAEGDAGAQATSHLARLSHVHTRATEALGNAQKAASWLAAPNRGLDGKRPVDQLDSDAGVKLVEAILQRIEHGIFG